MSLKEDQHVTLTTVDNQSYKGILSSIDENSGKIVLRNVSSQKIKLPGLHNFYASNIKDLAFTDGLQDVGINVTNSAKSQMNRRKQLQCRKDKPRHLKELTRFDSDQLVRSPCNCIGDDSGDQGIGSAEENENFEDYSEMDNFVIFHRTCDRFRHSISYLMEQDVIAVTFYGMDISRNGSLSLIQVASEKRIFMFDIQRLGVEGFVDGLQAILESQDLLKVIHDCRMVSDLLYHQYNVTLSNIFDTQVAGAFVFRMSNGGDWPRYVDNLPTSLMAHLGLENEDVYHFFVRERSKQDEDVWNQRPLCKQLLQDSVKNLIPLISLYHTLQAKMMTEFEVGVQLYLDQVRGAPQDSVEKFRSLTHLLPFVFQDMPKLAAHSAKRTPAYRIPSKKSYDSHGFLDVCQGKSNPMVIASKDSIWHSKDDFSPASKCHLQNTTSVKAKSSALGFTEAKSVPSTKSNPNKSFERNDDNVNSKSKNECRENQIDHLTSSLRASALSDLKSRLALPSRQEAEHLSSMNREWLQLDSSEQKTDDDSCIEESMTRSAVERSALHRIPTPSCSSASSTCSEVLTDSEIFDLRRDTPPSKLGDWDVDKVLEFEMSRRILHQARQVDSKSVTKRRLLPSKVKLSPRSGDRC